MITTKSHDTSYFEKNLYSALENAFQRSDIEDFWVQKYIDDHQIYWDVSLEKNGDGMRLLSDLELLGVYHLSEQIIDDDDERLYHSLLKNLENIVGSRWDEDKTIRVTTDTYYDNYDMCGVRRSDFG